MSLKDKVDDLNTKGVSCLQDGKHIDALSFFENARELLILNLETDVPESISATSSLDEGSLISDTAAIDNYQYGNESDYEDERLFASIPSDDSSSGSETRGELFDQIQSTPISSLLSVPQSDIKQYLASKSTKPSRWSENLFAFYQRAFLFSSPSIHHDKYAVQGQDQKPCQDKDLAIILFNIALCYHSRGMKQSQALVSPFFSRAIDFYAEVFTIIQQSWSDFEAQNFLLILLATLNNLGHIHSHLDQYLETKHIVETLKNVIKVGRSACTLFQEDDFAFFCSNVLVFDVHEFSGSPAA